MQTIEKWVLLVDLGIVMELNFGVKENCVVVINIGIGSNTSWGHMYN